MLLALLGAALGARLAALLSRGLVAFLTTRADRMFVGIRIDWRVLGFTAGDGAADVPAVRAGSRRFARPESRRHR